ncbi:MAG: N-acetyltransferase family protein [Kofleriaceae bacterium]
MIALRFARVGDAPAIAALVDSLVRTTAINFKSTGPTGEQLAARFEAELPIYPWVVAYDGDRFAGYAMARDCGGAEGERWNVETGLTLAPEACGKGLGTRVYAATLAILAAQGFHNAFATITLPNPASLALHRRLEFTECGTHPRAGWKLDRWHDVSWWHKALATGAPGELIAPAAVDPAVLARVFGEQ